ncbi:MAG: hypothetical protein K6C08_08980 [Oscillospiraceae bacterium]|nr:hypothetical protein [Oscillospiraceae bacterium]
MHEFYNQDNIDVLFIGASHCYRGYDTDVTDQLFNCNTFNLGSSSQTMDTSYFLIREAVDRYDISHIYLDISYNIACLPIGEGESLQSVYIITDYTHPSLRKLNYLLDRSETDDLSNSFLIARRNWENLFNLPYISDVIKIKTGDAYKDYSYVIRSNEEYAGKGFVASYSELKADGFYDSVSNETFDLYAIDDQWSESLINIIQFCKENDVALTLVSAPVSSYRLMCYEEYDDFIALVNRIISESEADVEYYNFNLLRREFWPDTVTSFKDLSHLNAEGARQYSTLFSEFFLGKYTADELFYTSIKEKYEDLPASFYGLVYNTNPKESKYIPCHMIVNHAEDFESRVFIQSEAGKVVLKELSSGLDFFIPAEYHGWCSIELLFHNGTKITYRVNVQY